jgi:hypothetical protein
VASVAAGLRNTFLGGDSYFTVVGADWILEHVRRGQWTGWKGLYPLLQTIPALVLRAAGASPDGIVWGFVVINVLSFFGLLRLAWHSRRTTSTALAVFLVAAMFSGPLVWYTHTSFAEPLGAFLILAFVVACRERTGSLAVAALLVVASFYKDTAFPFLPVLGVAASMRSPRWVQSQFVRRRLSALVIATAITAAASAAFNYVRFGSVLNTSYLNPITLVPSLRTQASWFLAIWFSPNGGVVLFWPSITLLLLLGAVAAMRAAQAADRGRVRVLALAPAGLVALVLLGVTAGLSKWWSPLGWAAWGPRLLLPWLPACAYVMLAAYPAQVGSLLATLTRPAWRFAVFSVLLAAASFPQFAVVFSKTIWVQVFAPDAACPQVPLVDKNPDYYYRCAEHMLWTKGSMLGLAYSGAADGLSLLLSLGCASVLIWLISEARPKSVAHDTPRRVAGQPPGGA